MDAGRLVLAALALCGCERLPTGPATTSHNQARGITLVDWTASGYASPTAADAIAALAATGANTAVIVVTGYQDDRGSGWVRAGDPRTPTPAAVQSAIARALTVGLRVVLKPHVDLDDGSWRGRIEPRDPAAWFASYRQFVLPWAALAQSSGADQFVVGTELAGTVDHEALWRETIQAVRGVFSGTVFYAASWDEAARVPFWSDLDRVGIDFYFPVASRKDPGRLEILAAWQPWLERLRRLHRQTGKPILLTEVGYRSEDGAGMAPYALGGGEALDFGEQADLYWAALEATGDQAWIAGLWWWDWPADGSGGPRDPGYTARGKPAALELESAWGRVSSAGMVAAP